MMNVDCFLNWVAENDGDSVVSPKSMSVVVTMDEVRTIFPISYEFGTWMIDESLVNKFITDHAERG